MATSPAVTKAVRRFNPYALKVSSRVPPWATLHHVGRKSGRQYRTPVVAFAARAPIDPATVASPGAPVAISDTRDVLVLHPLPWGPDVDWCRNIRAAGSYTLTRKGVDYAVDDLHVVDAAEARRLLGKSGRLMGRVPPIEQFLLGRLRRLPTGSAGSR